MNIYEVGVEVEAAQEEVSTYTYVFYVFALSAAQAKSHALQDNPNVSNVSNVSRVRAKLVRRGWYAKWPTCSGCGSQNHRIEACEVSTPVTTLSVGATCRVCDLPLTVKVLLRG